MATHDYVIANGTGNAVRSDLNNALAAIVSNNSSSSEPATTYAYQFWADLTRGVLQIRNSANNAWVTLFQLDGTMLMEDGTVSAPGLAFATDLNTGFFSGGADKINFATGGAERLEIGSSEIVFNDPSNDVDFRVESNSNTHMLFVDGGNNVVGIGTSAPSALLHISKTVNSGDVGLIVQNTGTSSNTASIYLNKGSGAEPDHRIQNDTGGNLTFASGTNESSYTEQMRIDSSGRLLIGKTSTSANDAPLQVTSLTGAQLQVQCSQAGGAYALFQNTNTGDTTADGLYVGTDNSINGYLWNYEAGNLVFGTSNAERLRIDSSGNVGIGTSAPTVLLDLESTNPTIRLTDSDASGTPECQISGGGGDLVLEADRDNEKSDSLIRFAIDGSEAMRIDGSGRLHLNTTTALINESQLSATGSGNTATFKTTVAGNNPLLLWNSATSGDNVFVSFFTESSYTARGKIDYNRSAGQTRYNVTSDSRLKSEIADSTTALNTLNTIRVRKYKWTETDYQIEHGFVAQELNAVVPDAVSVGDDGDEVTDAWSVDNSKLVPLLTKALQEAIAKIETLETKVAALEAG